MTTRRWLLAEHLLLFYGLIGLVVVARVPPALPGVLLRWAVFSVVAVAGVALVDPGHLFDMPRRQPWLWAATWVFPATAEILPW